MAEHPYSFDVLTHFNQSLLMVGALNNRTFPSEHQQIIAQERLALQRYALMQNMLLLRNAIVITASWQQEVINSTYPK
jgi:hypothetical protein